MKQALAASMIACASSAMAFESLNKETDMLFSDVECPEVKNVGGDNTYGRMNICTAGHGETLKLYVNEVYADTGQPEGQVRSIKLMWRDWHEGNDQGLSAHAGKPNAERWIEVIAGKYAEEQATDVKERFLNDDSETFTSTDYQLKITFEPDYRSGMDLHLLEITPR